MDVVVGSVKVSRDRMFFICMVSFWGVGRLVFDIVCV